MTTTTTGGRTRRRMAALAVAGVAAATLLAGQLAGSSAQADSSSDTTLTVTADTQMTTFNPFLSYYDGELNVIGAIYPALTMLDDKGKPVPYLADSWTTSPDKLTWTFKIHPGLKWSDGQPLTAKDAAWTFNLIMHNATAATSNGSLVENFKSVTAPDDTTLVITTKKPQANMLYLSIPVSGIAIVPEHIWKSHVADLKNYRNMDFPVVGYGPFVLTGFKTNQYASMTANKDFFQGAPGYDKVVTNYYANSDAAAAALTSGQLQQISGLTPAQYNAMSDKQDMMTYETQSNGWTAVEINSGAKTRSGKPIGTGNPILKDIKVRQAIALGINRDELVTKVLDGNGIVGAGYLPPGYPQFFWKPSASESLDYDPARAKQMLDQAGYKMGPNGVRVAPDGKPLQFRLGIHSDDATDAAIAPYLREWMTAIGIKLDVNAMSFDQLNNNLAKGDWDMLMDGWSTGPDPTYLLSIQTCGTLPAGQRHERQHGRVLLQQAVRQAVQEAADAVRPGGARGDDRRHAEDPLRQQRGPDPLLQERALGDAHRPDDRLPAGLQGLGRVLPAAARLHQLVQGQAGCRGDDCERAGTGAELERAQVDRYRRA